jgi:DNA invertase Pin-like site-specific DNA recombinase
MKALKHGDVVTVVGLDRLAQSSRDLQNILHELQEIGCGFSSLGETWCDYHDRCRPIRDDDHGRYCRV